MSDEIFSAACKIAEHVGHGDTVDETLASAVECATTLLNCDECCTSVRQGSELVPWVWKHVNHGSLQRTALSVDEGFAAAMGRHRAPIAVSADSAKATAFKTFEDWSRNPGETFVCAPFVLHSQVLGAITIRHWKPRPYRREEFKYLSSIDTSSELNSAFPNWHGRMRISCWNWKRENSLRAARAFCNEILG